MVGVRQVYKQIILSLLINLINFDIKISIQASCDDAFLRHAYVAAFAASAFASGTVTHC